MIEEPRHQALNESAREIPQVYGPLLWALLGLNLADALFTGRALSLGASEANPLMAGLLGYGLWPAFAFKMGVVGVGACFLWAYRAEPLARWGAILVTFTYWSVVAYHLMHLTLLP